VGKPIGFWVNTFTSLGLVRRKAKRPAEKMRGRRRLIIEGLEPRQMLSGGSPDTPSLSDLIMPPSPPAASVATVAAAQAPSTSSTASQTQAAATTTDSSPSLDDLLLGSSLATDAAQSLSASAGDSQTADSSDDSGSLDGSLGGAQPMIVLPSHTTLYFDPGQRGPSSGTASGWTNAQNVWDTSTIEWYYPTTHVDVAWSNTANNVAVFGGTSAGKVTITANPGVTATGITFSTSGYDIESQTGHNYTLTLSAVSGSNQSVVSVSGSETIGAAIAGAASGGLTVAGGGTLILTASNIYNGATATISSGSTLQLGNGSAAGPVTANLTDNGSLVFDLPASPTSTSYSGTISGSGSLTQIGAGSTVVLSGANNSYSGGTTVSAGAIGVASDGNLGNGLGVLTLNGGTLEFTATQVTVSRDIILGNGGGTIDSDNSPKVSGVISGGGSLTESGGGTLILTGTNSYSGGTTISSGSALQVGNGGDSGSISDSGSIYIYSDGSLTFDNSLGTTCSATISGGGSLTQECGTLTLTGNSCGYTGTATISAGTLQIGNGAAAGWISSTTIYDNGNLAFDRSDSPTYSAAISGTGGVTQKGSGTLTLTGNNSYSGATTISAGTLQIGNGGASGSINDTSNIYDYGSLTFDNSGSPTYSAAISGSGTLTQEYGMLTLTGNNYYCGGTTINSGTLQVRSSAALGSGALTLNGGTLQTIASGTFANSVTLGSNGGTLDTDDNVVVTFSGAISGAGYLAVSGGGTLTLTGNNSYTGSTTVWAGTTLEVTGDNALGSGTVYDDGTLAFNVGNGYIDLCNSISGSGAITVSGDGLLCLADAVDCSGQTTIKPGSALQLGLDSDDTYMMGKIVDNGSLSLDFSGGYWSSAITGGGSVTVSGGGATFTGTNTYSGGTTIEPWATLQAGNSQALGTGEVCVDGTLDLDGNNVSVGTLAGSGIIDNLDQSGTGTYTVTVAAGGDFSGTIQNTHGSVALALTGGTLILTANNNYSGSTVITQGTLQLGDGSATGWVSGAITDNGNLAFDRSDSPTYADTITGTGSVVVIGGGVTFTGNNNYSRGTTIDPGATLQIGSGGSTGWVSGDIIDDGNLAFYLSTSPTYSDTILGSGNLTQSGSGTLNLTGANTYTGKTIVADGTLSISGSIISPVELAGGQISGTGTWPTTNLTVDTTTAVSISDTTNAQDGSNPTYGDVITISATVKPKESGVSIPSTDDETVDFQDLTTGQDLGWATLTPNSDGSATATWSGLADNDYNLALGGHKIIAVYSGDDNFSGSQSPCDQPNINVVGEPLTVSLGSPTWSGSDPDTMYQGETATLSGNVSGLDGAAFSVNVDWGDGTFNSDSDNGGQAFYFGPGSTVLDGATSFGVSHYYASSGSFTPQVTVSVVPSQMDQGDQRQATASVGVDPGAAAPQVFVAISPTPTSPELDPGTTYDLTAEAFSPDPSTMNYSWAVYDREGNKIATYTDAGQKLTGAELQNTVLTAYNSVAPTNICFGDTNNLMGLNPTVTLPTLTITESDPGGMVYAGDYAHFDVQAEWAAPASDQCHLFWQPAVFYNTVDSSGSAPTAYQSTRGPQAVSFGSPVYDSATNTYSEDGTVTVKTVGGLDDGQDGSVTVQLLHPFECQISGSGRATATILNGLAVDADNDDYNGAPDHDASDVAQSGGKIIAVQRKDPDTGDADPNTYLVPMDVNLSGLDSDDTVEFTETGSDGLDLWTDGSPSGTNTEIQVDKPYSVSDLEQALPQSPAPGGSGWNQMYVQALSTGVTVVDMTLVSSDGDQPPAPSLLGEVKFTAIDENISCLQCELGLTVHDGQLISAADDVPGGGTRSSTSADGQDTSIGQDMALVLTGNGVAVVQNDNVQIWDRYGSDDGLEPRDPDQGSMEKEGNDYVETDPDGTTWTFSGSGPDLGQLLSETPASGSGDVSDSYNGDGQLTSSTTDMGSSGGQPVYQTAWYTYDSNGKVASQTVRQGTSPSGPAINSASYTYYTYNGANGNIGDLETVTTYDGDTTGAPTGTTYYRYYEGGSSADDVKYVFNTAAFARLVSNKVPNGDQGNLAATIAYLNDYSDDAVLQQYADNYFTYNSDGTVFSETTSGTGDSSSGGQGTVTYAYKFSGQPDGPNTWYCETIETLGDGSVVTTFDNSAGQVLLSDTASSSLSGAQHSITWNEYDANGNLILAAEPSAISSYTVPTDDNDNPTGALNVTWSGSGSQYGYVGLVDVSAYYASTAANGPGGVTGYLQASGVQQGIYGTPVWQSSVDYIAATLNGVTVYETADSTQYQDYLTTTNNVPPTPSSTSSDPDADTTSYEYTFYPAGQLPAGSGPVMETETTLLPTVGNGENGQPAQNGSGTPNSSTDIYNTYGQVVWSKDAAGSISYTQYDPATGAVVEQITDADVNYVGTNQNTPQYGGFTASDWALLTAQGWETSGGTYQNLVTTYQVDSQGRTIEETDPDGDVTWTVYNDAAQETFTYSGWRQDGSGNWCPTGPVELSHQDSAGTYTESLSYAWNGNDLSDLQQYVINGAPTGNEFNSTELADSTIIIESLSRDLMNSSGQVTASLQYTSLSGTAYTQSTAAFGVKGTNYLETDSYYSAVGELISTCNPDGTIDDTVYDYLGNAVAQWQGTYDPTPDYFQSWATNPANSSATTGPSGTSMVKISSSTYDADGNLIESTAYASATVSYPTYYQYDWRDRQMGTVGPDGVATMDVDSDGNEAIDNLGEVTETRTYADATYNTTTDQIQYTSEDLRGQTTDAYDDQGRVYQSCVYYVAPSTSVAPDQPPGTVGDYLATNSWYDSRGNLVATQTGDGAFQKSQYNSAGELVASYTTVNTAEAALTDPAEQYKLAMTVNGDPNYSGGDIPGDTVVEQTLNWYDPDGQTVATATYQRLPGDTTSTGPLTALDSYVTASVTFYDAAGDDIEDVNYGRQDVIDATESTAFFSYGQPGVANGSLIATNGIPNMAEASNLRSPNSSPDYIVSQTAYTYDAMGPVVSTTNNAGIVTWTQSDLAGNTLRTIQDFDGKAYGQAGSGFGSSGNVLDTDMAEDLTTDYHYDSAGRLATMTVYDAQGPGTTLQSQVTEYIYGSTVDASLVTAVVDPGSTDTVSQDSSGDWSITTDTGDHTSTTYDWMGDTLTSTDERGVVHTYSYDSAGRQVADTVTSFGSSGAVDQTVNAIVTTYDDMGRVRTVSSEGLVNGVETILNQVEYAYDGWGNESQEWQSQTGPVDTSSTPSVQYIYADGAHGTGVAEYMRLTEMIYPNSRELEYGYGTSGSIDDALSLVATIGGSDGTYATYTYLGADTIASQYEDLGAANGYADLQIGLDYSTNNFSAWDQFGRVVNQDWNMYSNSGGVLTSLGTLDGYTYGYDADGNVQWKQNVGQGATGLDELYTYDNLGRLTNVERGTLSGQNTSDPTITGATFSQSWDLDSLGNDLNAGSYNAANEFTSISGATSNPTYDAAGNLTFDGTNYYTYDAWDRLTAVRTGSATGPLMAHYEYDGTGRRVAETSYDSSGNATVTYYLFDGQNEIETRSAAFTGAQAPSPQSLTPTYQYVWSLLGDKTPLLRDSFSGPTEGRLYYTTDANGNVTAVVGQQTDGSWGVSERYVYSPYGAVTYYAPDWSSSSTAWNSSLNASVQNTLLSAAMDLDATTGLYYDEARWYSTSLGTFITQDPAQADPNLYRYCGNDPTAAVDPTGLWTKPKREPYLSWAKTCAQPGDTWASLAAKLGLDPREYLKWVEEGPPLPALPTPGATYHIPNVVIAYTTTDSWYLFRLPSMRHLCERSVVDSVARYASKGYKVVYQLGADSKAKFISDWKTPGIFAFAFAGHGGEVETNGPTLYVGYYTEGVSEASLVRPDQVQPPYKLQAIGAFFCGSAVRNWKTVHIVNGPDMTNRLVETISWQALVSPWGTFVGFNGSPNLYDYDVYAVKVRPGNVPN
jgi:RHS repeat-associated protein